MVKDAITQKMDWHENGAFNGGKSANERYMTEVFEVDKGMASRNRTPLQRLKGRAFGIAETIQNEVYHVRNRWIKGMLIIGALIASAGTAGYIYLNRNKFKKHDEQEKPLNKVA